MNTIELAGFASWLAEKGAKSIYSGPYALWTIPDAKDRPLIYNTEQLAEMFVKDVADGQTRINTTRS